MDKRNHFQVLKIVLEETFTEGVALTLSSERYELEYGLEVKENGRIVVCDLGDSRAISTSFLAVARRMQRARLNPNTVSLLLIFRDMINESRVTPLED